MLNRYVCTLTCCLVLLWVFTGCTENDLVTDTPKGGEVRFTYDWGSYGNLPDSMAIMAVRVVNHYKRGMMMQTTGDPLLGHYFYNPPEKVEAWVDPNNVPPAPQPRTENNEVIDPTQDYNGGVNPDYFTPKGEYVEPEVDKTTIKVDHFALPSGTYKFYALGMDDKLYDHVYTNLSQYMRAAGTGLQYSEVEMVYNVHKPTEAGYNLLGEDYNQGFDLIHPNYPPIYVDRLELLDVSEGADATISYQPKPLTQNIEINLMFEKDTKVPFTIERVVGEISGIPSKATAFDGHLYLAKTNKMQFSTTLSDENGNPDGMTNKKVRMHADINVLSILHSDKATDLTGPGILQLAVTYKTADGTLWTVHGKINLFNTLKKANLITYSDDWQYAYKSTDHAVLDIPTAIKISADGTTSGGTGDGGIDEWNQWGNATIDDGNGVELY